MDDRYGRADWPHDWYSMEMDFGWAFVSPSKPGVIVVVAANGRIAEVRTQDPGKASDAAQRALRVLR